jgi:hypothetical protein
VGYALITAPFHTFTYNNEIREEYLHVFLRGD